MKVPLVLMCSFILMSSFPVISGAFEIDGNDETDDMNNDESSPRQMYHQSNFRISPKTPTPVDEKGVPRQYPVWDNHMQTLDTTFNSLKNSNKVYAMLRKLEVKFDRILDAVDFDEDNQMDDMRNVINKLNTIQRDIRRSSKNNVLLRCPRESSELSQINLIKELIAAVDYANEKINNVAIDLDQVTTNFKKSAQSLEKLGGTTRVIDDRTNRIYDTSSRQAWPRNTLSDN